ncbi:MAG: hypothetical protein MSS98_07545 [Alphaproteobacteria bacterium]|nr:hypothetical protein [Alphaproteobacteria bacterium]
MANFDYFEFLKNSDNSKFDKEQFKLVLDECPGYGNIERDEYFTILDKRVRRLYGYLQRKSNVDVIRLLLEKAKQLPAPSHENLWGLDVALEFMFDDDSNKLLDDCDLQLDILNLQNERVAMRLLRHFDYLKYPQEQVIEKLVQLKMIKPLRYLLSHSIAGTKIKEVCQALPQLKLEVYLAELARLTHLVKIGPFMLLDNEKTRMITLDDEKKYHALRISEYIKHIEDSRHAPWSDTMEGIHVKLYLEGDNEQVRQECLYHAKKLCDVWKKIPEIAFFRDILRNIEDF